MRQALYIFECSFHPKFLNCLENGTARMDLDVGMNQSFGNCIFAYALMAGRRGSRRAAQMLFVNIELTGSFERSVVYRFLCNVILRVQVVFRLYVHIPRKFGIPPIAGTRSKNVFVPVTALPNIFLRKPYPYYLGRGKKETANQMM